MQCTDSLCSQTLVESVANDIDSRDDRENEGAIAMAKKPAARKGPGSTKIPSATLAELNAGTREAANLAECLAVDFVALWHATMPDIDPAPLKIGKPSITERMRLSGQILLEEAGIDRLSEFADHASDTVRGWACYAIGLVDGRSLEERFDAIRPLADDAHFGVREWAWLAIRPWIVADVERAIELLKPWVGDESAYLRRFAVESTRPRGVWAEHIEHLKQKPKLGLPLLKPLRADPEKYVQDSVSNWLNDAAKTQPDWVRDLVEGWADGCDDKNTLRICKRAIRSIGE
jgi:3-methyladenine DNA glycosylase AlkC